jgi:hypothetical protein
MWVATYLIVSVNNEDIFNSTESDFNGIRIVYNNNPFLNQLYSKVKINENIKYLQKKIGLLVIIEQRNKVSTDRLSGVV